MKIQIIFDTESEDDVYKMKIYKQAEQMHEALSDFKEYLRQQYKYSEKPDDIEKIHERFYSIMNENNVLIE